MSGPLRRGHINEAWSVGNDRHTAQAVAQDREPRDSQACARGCFSWICEKPSVEENGL